MPLFWSPQKKKKLIDQILLQAELGSTSQGVSLSFLKDVSNMEDDDLNQFP